MSGKSILDKYNSDMRALMDTIPKNPSTDFWTNFSTSILALHAQLNADLKTATWN